MSPSSLDDYLNEFTFLFNRRRSASRGKLFYRLAQQAVQIEPVPFAKLVKPQPVGDGGINRVPKPFIWHKTADQILDSVAARVV
jgi:hypothetical protein